jgi:hypothetical protein
MCEAIPPLLQYAFMAWCLVKHRDNFTFNLTVMSADHLRPHPENELCCGDRIGVDGLMSGNLKGRDHLEYIGISGSIILKWILTREGIRM